MGLNDPATSTWRLGCSANACTCPVIAEFLPKANDGSTVPSGLRTTTLSMNDGVEAPFGCTVVNDPPTMMWPFDSTLTVLPRALKLGLKLGSSTPLAETRPM